MPSDTVTSTTPAQLSLPFRNGLLIGLAVIAGTGLVWALEQTGPQTFPGSLEAHKTIVSTHCAARVKALSVSTGQSVASGDALFQLVDAQLEDRLTAKRRDVVEFEAEVVRSKAVAEMELTWRRRDLQSEIFETKLRIASLSQEKVNKQVERIALSEHLNNPESGQLLPALDHPFRSVSLNVQTSDDRRLNALLREDAAAASADTLATQVALCEQRLKDLESLEKGLEAKVRASSGVDVAEAKVTGAKQELATLEAQLNELTITSPTYGMIGEVKLHPGDRVPQGSTIVEILDDQQPHVVALVPSSLATKAHQGSKVTIIFPLNEQRTGVVSSIPPQTVSNAGTTESYLPIKIEPIGKLWPKLANGSNVRVQLQ